MEYLVTGGAGFIGSNIVRRLVAEGARVRVLDNLSTGRASNLAGLEDRIELLQADVADLGTVQAAVRGVRYVLHLAAMPSVQRSIEDPVGSDRVNIGGTIHVLVAARDAGVRRVVFSSSSSVYGDTPQLPKQEDLPPRPLSPYAVQKLAGEHYARIFHALYGLRVVILRYFNVFGPRQNPHSQYAAVIPRFIDALRNKRPPTIHGDGEQTRDFTYVDDVVEANLRCCEAPEEADGQVFNIAAGRRTSVNELAGTLSRLLNCRIEPVYDAPVPGEVRHSEGDISRARRLLGWEPRVALEEGLRRTVAYFEEVARGLGEGCISSRPGGRAS